MSSSKSAGALLAFTLALLSAEPAGAGDIRSWDQKIPAKDRYVVLGAFDNKAVLDRETQLVWQRQLEDVAIWSSAIHLCRASVTGGRSGWRLPTIEEFGSLMAEYQQLPAGHPFEIRSKSRYWTASMAPGDSTRALTKNLDETVFTPRSKSEYNYVMCVRGPVAN